MTEIRIRPFEDPDYPAIVALGNAIYTDYPWSVDEARHEDARYDGGKFLLRRWVAEAADGRLVGVTEFHHVTNMYHPQKFWIDVEVHPEYRGRGVGRRLYAHLVDALTPHRPVLLWTGVRETFAESIQFVTRRGFREIRRAWESRLDVAAFDPAPFEAKAQRAITGLTVTTVAEEQRRDAQWREKLYKMDSTVAADAPRPDRYTPITIDEFSRRLFENPDYVPEGHFLAKDGDRYVAESFLFRSHELPGVLYQGLTGTRRAYRGRGVALALKLQVVAFARRGGYREIRTWNDTMNAPMLHINTRMGFVRQPAWITFENRLAEAAP